VGRVLSAVQRMAFGGMLVAPFARQAMLTICKNFKSMGRI